MNKDIYLTNSLGNKKEKFVPININKIGMYVCGPTVYDDPHIGNARPLVVFDLLYKVLKCKFGEKKITYVRNITDIDDNKIGMYVCGPTVYDFPHIGNARPLVVFDVLFRLLKRSTEKIKLLT